jgi:hypothetical protein
MSALNSRYSVTFVSLILVAGLLGFTPAFASNSGRNCESQFQATVTGGPDAGFTMAGHLNMVIASDGTITGVLLENGGVHVPVSGSVGSGQISLAFHRGNGGVLTGTGSVDNPFTCKGTIGGTLTGPNAGDAGTWSGRDANLFSGT